MCIRDRIGAEIFAALGHESRLAIFRLLIEAGPGSINAAAIGEKPGIPNAALSSHLSHLSRVGPVSYTHLDVYKRQLVHHWDSHGTPSPSPSIWVFGQFLRKYVASAQEVICEQ